MSQVNRFAVTVRFNQAEQANLRALCQFWSVSEKQALKFAFEQMVQSTEQLQAKLKKEEAEKSAAETTQPDTQESISA